MTLEIAIRIVQSLSALILLLQWPAFRKQWNRFATLSTLLAVVLLCTGLTFGVLIKGLIWAGPLTFSPTTHLLVIALDTFSLASIGILGINAHLAKEDNTTVTSS